MVHGLNRSRIEMVRRAPFVHAAGWNALLIDLRHHGASGGEATTFGAKEKEDVKAAVAPRARALARARSWSGACRSAAASVVFAAAEDPEVAGVICDSSFRSLDDTVRHHLQLFRGFRWWLRIVPSWPVADLALFWMGRRGGFDPAAVGRAWRPRRT